MAAASRGFLEKVHDARSGRGAVVAETDARSVRLAARAGLVMAGLFLLFVGAAIAAEPVPSASEVVLLANSNDSESMELARYYAARRGVPLANLFAYPMSSAETITWPEFVSSIWEPLQEDLVAKNWIDAIPMQPCDAAGRRKYAVNGHHIAYLVVFRGVPLRVDEDPMIRDEAYALTMARDPSLQTNRCSVDSELTLLAQSVHAIVSFIPNPLFHNARPGGFGEERVVKVARIDGPTQKDAQHLIDVGLEAEGKGLIGRAYIDTGGPYPEGNRWFDNAVRKVRALGFDLDVDREPGTMPVTARFDAPAIYLGWYTGTLNGPFCLPGERLVPGAVAYHLHSFSAATLRSGIAGWCGPLVAHGAAGTLGNVFEPYLALTQRPDLFIEALGWGWTLGDAAYYATPGLGWQQVVVGDPLYRPMAVGIDAQWAARKSLTPREAGYVVLRRMNLLENEGEDAEALRLGESELDARPSPALAYGIARRLARNGAKGDVVRVLSAVAPSEFSRPEDWALGRAIARLLEDNGGAERAVALYAGLLKEPGMTRELRVWFLTDACRVASLAGDKERASGWSNELAHLNGVP